MKLPKEETGVDYKVLAADNKEARFLSQPNDWLPQLTYGDTTIGTHGTPSPDQDVAV